MAGGDAEELLEVSGWRSELRTLLMDGDDPQVRVASSVVFLRRVAASAQPEQLALRLLEPEDDVAGALAEPMFFRALALLDCIKVGGAEDAENDAGNAIQHARTPVVLAALTLVARHLTITRLEDADVEAAITTGERAMELVAGTNTCAEGGEQGAAREDAVWPIEVANILIRLHQCGPRWHQHFKVMTFVWKHLTRLSTTFGARLWHHEDAVSMNENPEMNGHSPRMVLDAVLTAITNLSNELRRDGTSPRATSASTRQILKVLRVFMRAQQGLFLVLADALVSQVEGSLSVVINLVSSLVSHLEGRTDGHGKGPGQVSHEARRVLEIALNFCEMTVASDQLQASTRSFVHSFLWQPDAQLSLVVEQVHAQYLTGTEFIPVDANCHSLAHLLVLTAVSYAGVEHNLDGIDMTIIPTKSSEVIDSQVLRIAGALIEKYRKWHRGIFATDFSKSRVIFIDSILQLLSREGDQAAFISFLFGQVANPDSSTRFLSWHIWREVMCFWVDEQTSFELLEMLLTISRRPDDFVARGFSDEILRLIVFMYPDLPSSVKLECLSYVTTVIDQACKEGPNFNLNKEGTSKVDFLEVLTGAYFLLEFDDPAKESWIAHYLPTVVECIGTIVDLLDTKAAMTSRIEKDGMIRVLDVSLLVVKSVFDDNEARESGSDELSAMLLPMCGETLTLMSKLELQQRASSTKSCARASFIRVVATCLDLLSCLGASMKLNRNNQYVQVLKDLASILDVSPNQTGIEVEIAVFLQDALGGVCVSPSDVNVVWSLAERIFRRSTAVHFGLQLKESSLSPGQLSIFAAFFELISKTNIPIAQGRSRSLKSFIVPHAREAFTTYLKMRQLSAATTIPARNNSIARYRYDWIDHVHCERFPTGLNDHAAKRQREEMIADECDQIFECSAKRLKWMQFVALHRRLNDRLEEFSACDFEGPLVGAIDDRDLDTATTALEMLLSRSSTLKKG